MTSPTSSPSSSAPDPAVAPADAAPAIRDGSPLQPFPPTGWSPRAVVFDCDGLLVDTESEWIATQDAYLAQQQATLPEETRRSIIGGSARTVVAALSEVTGEEPERIVEQLVALHAEHALDEAVPMPGAARTVRAIAERVPVGVASNSPREMLDAKLTALGIADVVDASVAIEDVELGKPAPDMYALAARRLGADPAQTLAFEDSETGAQAARDAGLVLIAVPSHPGQNPPADHHLASLEDEDLHRWIATWESVR